MKHMGRTFAAKCRKCGFEGVGRTGLDMDKLYRYYGCPRCKKLITIDIRHEKDAWEKAAKGVCPGCGGKIIDYRSAEYTEKSKGKDALLCPKCMTYNLRLEWGLVL